MTGILANSASQSMSTAIRHGVVAHFVINEVITLTFTESADSYFWYMEAPFQSHAMLNNRNGPSPTFTPDFLGEYTIGLIADQRFYTLKLTTQPGTGVGGVEAIAIAAGEDIAAIMAINPGRRFVLGTGVHSLAVDVGDPDEEDTRIKLVSGTRLQLSDDVTLNTGVVFADGGRIVPASGKTVTINGPIDLPVTHHAFDISEGGSFAFGLGSLNTFHPRNFGAAGVTGTDDTAFVQAAITAAASVHGSVDLGDGSYDITAELIVPPVWGFAMRGQSRSGFGPGAYLLWKGTAAATPDSMLRLNNVREGVFENFFLSILDGNTDDPPTKAAVYHYQDDALLGTSSSAGCRFQNVTVHCGTLVPCGFQIDYATGSSFDNSFHTYDQVTVYGVTRSCWLLGREDHLAPNAKGIEFRNCIADCSGGGLRGVEAWSANFQWHGGFVAVAAEEGFRVGWQGDPVQIEGCQFELCNRFLRVAGPSESQIGLSIPITFRNNRCIANALNADGYGIHAAYPGPLTLENNLFGSQGDDNHVKIYFGATSAVGGLTVHSNLWGHYGADTEQILFPQPADRIWFFNNEAYDSGGNQAHIPDQLPAVAPFDPIALAPCVMLLNADVGVSGSGATLAWLDQSRFGNDVAADAGASGLTYTIQEPDLRNHATVDFNGTDDFLTAASNIGAGIFYMVMVAKFNTLPTGAGSISNILTFSRSSDADPFMTYRLAVDTTGHVQDSLRRDNSGGSFSDQLGDTQTLDNSIHVDEWLYDGTNVSMYRDGAQVLAPVAQTGTITIDQLFIGAEVLGAGVAANFAPMSLSFMALYSAVPDPIERAAFIRELKVIYGVS